MKRKPSKKQRPDDPKLIAEKAAQMPWKESARIDLYPHQAAIVTLRKRGYSYGEIGEWLAKELSAPVKRGQVYYIYQQYLLESEVAFDAAEKRGEVEYLPTPKLSEDEADKKAAEEDTRKK